MFDDDPTDLFMQSRAAPSFVRRERHDGQPSAAIIGTAEQVGRAWSFTTVSMSS